MFFDLGVDLSCLWKLLDDSLVSIRIISNFRLATTPLEFVFHNDSVEPK